MSYRDPELDALFGELRKRQRRHGSVSTDAIRALLDRELSEREARGVAIATVLEPSTREHMMRLLARRRRLARRVVVLRRLGMGLAAAAVLLIASVWPPRQVEQRSERQRAAVDSIVQYSPKLKTAAPAEVGGAFWSVLQVLCLPLGKTVSPGTKDEVLRLSRDLNDHTLAQARTSVVFALLKRELDWGDMALHVLPLPSLAGVGRRTQLFPRLTDPLLPSVLARAFHLTGQDPFDFALDLKQLVAQETLIACSPQVFEARRRAP